jgi:hypothetical protein
LSVVDSPIDELLEKTTKVSWDGCQQYSPNRGGKRTANSSQNSCKSSYLTHVGGDWGNDIVDYVVWLKLSVEP